MALSGKFSTNAYDGRYYTCYWNATQSIEKNQSTINWSIYAEGQNGYWYMERRLYAVLAGAVLVNKADSVQRYNGCVASGSFAVNHASDGTFNFSGSMEVAVFQSYVTCTGSANFSLNKIPRQATLNSAPDFTDEDNPKITYSNPAGSAVSSLKACISLTGAKDDVPYRDISIKGGSYTFSLTEEERNALRNGTTGTGRTLYFMIRTTIGGKNYYSNLIRKFTILNGTPLLSPSVKDVNEKTLALTGDENIFVRYYSTAYVETGAQARKGAAISKESVACEGKKINEGSGDIPSVDSATFVFSATDSRNNTVSQTIVKDLIPYTRMTCELLAENPDVEGNTVLQIEGNVYAGTFGVKENEVSAYYRYKTENGEYGEWIPAGVIGAETERYTKTVQVSGLDYTKQYTFQAMAEDLLESANSVEKTVKTIPAFDWSKNDFRFHVPVEFMKGIKEYDLDKKWEKLKTVANNTNSIITVENLEKYSEFVITVGPIANGNTLARVLASTIIPKSKLVEYTTDHPYGAHQAVYNDGSNKFQGGISYTGDSQIKIYGADNSCIELWAR